MYDNNQSFLILIAKQKLEEFFVRLHYLALNQQNGIWFQNVLKGLVFVEAMDSVDGSFGLTELKLLKNHL